jgi:hypothetical protein
MVVEGNQFLFGSTFPYATRMMQRLASAANTCSDQYLGRIQSQVLKRI